MGRWGFIFFSEQIAQLEAFKQTLSSADEIADVEKTIELLRKRAEELDEKE